MTDPRQAQTVRRGRRADDRDIPHVAGRRTHGFARTLLGAEKSALHLRPIIAGSDPEQARGCSARPRAQATTLLPLDQRRHEAPRLINYLFQECGMTECVDAFAAERVARLASRDWRQNLDPLREAAVRLAAVLRHRNLTEAAAAIDPSVRARPARTRRSHDKRSVAISTVCSAVEPSAGALSRGAG